MVPFGVSFGDFVAALSLLKNLIDALDSTFGAQAEYRGLITQLYCLERALVAIKQLEIQCDSCEYDATQQAVQSCRECIDKFILKIASYQTLTAGKSSAKDLVRKIRWAQCRKEDLYKFKADLTIYVSAINVLLNTLQLTYSRHANTTTAASVETQTRVLSEIERSVKDNDESISGILQGMERLLQQRYAQQPESRTSTFVVRPLRLIDAPIAPNFVSRPEIMRDMEEHLLHLSHEKQKLLVLSGPGGIGKSQMAREYASQHRDHYNSIFWTNGKTEQSLHTSIAQIAELIPLPQVLDAAQKVPKNEGDIERAMHAVETWLSSDGNARWLVIIDNVDAQVEGRDAETVTEADGAYDVSEYIPAADQGSILITSRLSLLARDLGGYGVPVGEMGKEEALQVLHRASGRPYDEDGARVLIDRLGAYPLALAQAAKYIYENHTTTQTYLQRFDQDRKLLSKQNLTKREYKSGSIDIALGLSFTALKTRKPEAAAFLLLCGFLDSKDIFWQLFNASYEFADATTKEDDPASILRDLPFIPFESLKSKWLDEIASNEIEFDAIVKCLYEFSFVRRNEESDGISIHAVIHEWIVGYVEPKTRSQLLASAADIVADNYGARSETPCQRIQLHAYRCLSMAMPGNQYRKWSFGALFLLGAFYYDDEQTSLSQQLISCALDKLVLTFGEDSEMAALWSMRMTPMFIHSQPLETTIQQLCLAEYQLSSSPTPTDKTPQHRIDVRNHLCYAYQVQEDFAKAIEIGESTIEEATSSKVHFIYTCCATGLLAESYLALGRYEIAQTCSRIAIEQHEKLFGENPGDGSLSAWRGRNMTILAIACANLGELGLAEVVLVSVHVEAVRFNGMDDALSLHAKQNLDWLREIKARPGASSVVEGDGEQREEERDKEKFLKEGLQKLSTDRGIIYLRFDLAMPLFDTLGFVDRKIQLHGRR